MSFLEAWTIRCEYHVVGNQMRVHLPKSPILDILQFRPFSGYLLLHFPLQGDKVETMLFPVLFLQFVLYLTLLQYLIQKEYYGQKQLLPKSQETLATLVLAVQQVKYQKGHRMYVQKVQFSNLVLYNPLNI